jgi:Pyruvate/2-oxoacid:ferredoxin oxidoreductase delta subunit
MGAPTDGRKMNLRIMIKMSDSEDSGGYSCEECGVRCEETFYIKTYYSLTSGSVDSHMCAGCAIAYYTAEINEIRNISAKSDAGM